MNMPAFDTQRAAGCPRCSHPWDAHHEDNEELILRHEDGCALTGFCQLCESIDEQGNDMTTTTTEPTIYNAGQIAVLAGLSWKAFRQWLRDNDIQQDRDGYYYEFTAEQGLELVARYRAEGGR